MAGIFGCFNDNDHAKNKMHCSRMERSSVAGFSHTSEISTSADGALCFGYATRHTSPDCAIYSSEDSGEIVLICGELFLPSGEELSYKNFASEFLPKYKKNGKNCFLDCDGSYTLAIYDARAKQLQLISDPFGNFALHYAITEAGFLFSSQQLGIAEALGRKEFSEESLLEYLALGQQLEGRTFYKNIVRLPPGSILSIDRSGSAVLESYYSPTYEASDNTTNELRSIEESLLHALDIRIHRSGIAFGLSGGLDSRISLAALKKLGKTNSVTALTHGLRSSYDMRIARKLASKYSMNHHQIFFDDEFFKELPGHWKEITRLSEGGLGIESTYALASWQRQSKMFGISMESHGGPLYRRQILKARENTLQQAKDFPAALFPYMSSALLKSGLL
ncbi:MAG: asparagine synthase-related protein, partial [Bacteroidota bacterium]|nr:asparagine synthase-related protein [Bacteroidota bacterium]